MTQLHWPNLATVGVLIALVCAAGWLAHSGLVDGEVATALSAAAVAIAGALTGYVRDVLTDKKGDGT
jgi:hypothetical protein